MTARVRLPALFADRIDGVSSIDVSAKTVEDAIHALAELYPTLEALLLDAHGAVNPAVVAFRNDAQLSHDELSTAALADGDEIDLVPAIEGG